MLFLYSWRFPAAVVALLQSKNYRVLAYLRTFWGATDLNEVTAQINVRPTATIRRLIWLVRIGILLEVLAGLGLIYAWHWRDWPGGLAFGLALLIGYPIVWAHAIAAAAWVKLLANPKKLGKRVLCRILERQVRQLRAKNNITVVAVVGSVGKTSTKVAIAKTLGASRRVIWQEGNYNDRLTVPLIFFDHPLPGLFNIAAWMKIWLKNRRIIRDPYPYDIAVVELGPDGPGQMVDFAYVQPDLVVLTAITPEHMEFFRTLDAVAKEELTALGFSKQALVNIDDTPAQYLEGLTYLSYGLQHHAMYYGTRSKALGLQGQTMRMYLGKSHSFELTIPMLGEQGAKIAVAAAATAHILGVSNVDIEAGLQNIEAFAGRMRLLHGVHSSLLLDDSYNASPIAVKAALDVLYDVDAPQRIAILGSMNELGDYSPEAHREVGEHCDRSKLDLVVTVGPDAHKYIAPVAEKRGCAVKSFDSPYAAGEYVKKHIKEGAVVLAKGSQNRVFAEEAVKVLLADPNDASKLVRQSAYWMKIKAAQFSDAQTTLNK